MNKNESKLFLVNEGTAVGGLEFAKKILKYYGYEVFEFPAGPNTEWIDVYNKEV